MAAGASLAGCGWPMLAGPCAAPAACRGGLDPWRCSTTLHDGPSPPCSIHSGFLVRVAPAQSDGLPLSLVGSKEGRGATYAFEGPKRLLASARPYAIVVTKDSAPSPSPSPAGPPPALGTGWRGVRGRGWKGT